MKLFYYYSILFYFVISCNSEERMANTYRRQTKDFLELASISNAFYNQYSFKEIVIKYNSGINQIRFATIVEAPYKYFGCEVSPKDFSIIKVNYSDSLTKHEKEMCSRILTDSTLKYIMEKYMQLKIQAINISTEGVFFSLGSSVKSRNPEISAGILISSDTTQKYLNAIKQLEPGIYLYEMVVE